MRRGDKQLGVLEGKRIIVTGGLRGIGKAIVKMCLAEGAVVATTYYKSADKIDELRSECIEAKERLFIYQMDVTSHESVEEVMEQMQDDLQGIDVLVNNAGIIKDKLLYSLSYQDWDEVIKTNLYSCFYTCKNVLLNMVSQRSGSIINISSVSGLIGIAGQSNYCASKFGVIGITKALAKEVGQKNIRVNAIAPGYVDSDMTSKVNKNFDIKSQNLMKRLGTPEEIAQVVKFLASDESSYITGQVIVADGGIV